MEMIGAEEVVTPLPRADESEPVRKCPPHRRVHLRCPDCGAEFTGGHNPDVICGDCNQVINTPNPYKE
jgi:hypothetical protein